MKVIFVTVLLIFTFSVCFSQTVKEIHDTDTTLITYSSLQSSPVFHTDTFTYGKQMRVWFAIINDTKDTLLIDRITTADIGTLAQCGKRPCSIFKFLKGDTLTLCLYCDSNRPGNQLRSVTIVSAGEKENKYITFSVLTYARD